VEMRAAVIELVAFFILLRLSFPRSGLARGGRVNEPLPAVALLLEKDAGLVYAKARIEGEERIDSFPDRKRGGRHLGCRVRIVDRRSEMCVSPRPQLRESSLTLHFLGGDGSGRVQLESDSRVAHNCGENRSKKYSGAELKRFAVPCRSS
jgi:hypothetical protein